METVLELHEDKETVRILRYICTRMAIFDDEGLAYSCWKKEVINYFLSDLTPLKPIEFTKELAAIEAGQDMAKGVRTS